jgi:O-antigen ligase
MLSVINSMPYEHTKKYLWLIPLAVASAAILLFLEQNTGEHIYRSVREIGEDDRVSYSVYNRATVVVVLSMFSCLSIIGAYSKPKIWRAAFVLAFIPLLFITKSQSAQLALLIGLVFMFAFPYKKKLAWYGLILFIAILMILSPLLVTWFFGEYEASMRGLKETFLRKAYVGNRVEIWDYVSRYAMQSPLYGFGIEATRSIENFDSKEIYQAGKGILHPHNFVFQLWIEFGIIGIAGAIAFVSYLLSSMRANLNPKQRSITLSTFIASMYIGATGYGMWQGWWLGSLLLITSFCILAGKRYKHEGAVRINPNLSKAKKSIK